MGFLVKTFIFFMWFLNALHAGPEIMVGLSAGAMYQGGVFQGVNQTSGGGSFESKRNPYGVPAYLGAFHVGLQHIEGPFYMATFFYYTLNTFHKKVYYNATTPLVHDAVFFKTKGGLGGQLRFGLKNALSTIIPYALFGVEYTQRSFCYEATHLPNSVNTNHRKPLIVLGFGMQGKIYPKTFLSMDLQRKIGHEFDVQIPVSGGYPSLANHRVRVGTSHWALVASISYALNAKDA